MFLTVLLCSFPSFGLVVNRAVLIFTHGVSLCGRDEKLTRPFPDRNMLMLVYRSMIDLLGLSPEALIAEAAQAGFSRKRAQNLFRQLHENPGTPLLDLTGVHRPLRVHAHKNWTLAPIEPETNLSQPEDGNTRKLVFLTADGLPVETVLMPRKKGGFTLCVSSQVGCRVGCTFCRTGLMGLTRNLTAGEIVDQIRWARKFSGGNIRNVVYMGMGEPLENVPAVAASVKVIQAAEVYGISASRITVSTAGHVPGMRALAKAAPKLNLAVSLNAPTNALRDEIMPINRRYPIEELLQAVEEYPLPHSGTVMLEYVLLAGVNDRPEDAKALQDLLADRAIKLNLIRYNEVPDLPYKRPSEEAAARFRAQVGTVGKGVLLRYSWGGGIAAACGQLGSEVLRERNEKPLIPPAAPLKWTPLEV